MSATTETSGRRGIPVPRLQRCPNPAAPSFDLVRWAAQRGYRTRNLHNGRPVPPARPRGRGHRAYTGRATRWDAIVCRWGYVAANGDVFMVYADFETPRRKTLYRRRLVMAGARIIQEGDTEIGAIALPEQLEGVLAVLKPYRVGRIPPENGGAQAAESMQAAPGGGQGP